MFRPTENTMNPDKHVECNRENLLNKKQDSVRLKTLQPLGQQP